MLKSDCSKLMDNAEQQANEGQNEDAVDLFLRAAECWNRWESFGKAAEAYERGYEHAMLCNLFSNIRDIPQRCIARDLVSSPYIINNSKTAGDFYFIPLFKTAL